VKICGGRITNGGIWGVGIVWGMETEKIFSDDARGEEKGKCVLVAFGEAT